MNFVWELSCFTAPAKSAPVAKPPPSLQSPTHHNASGRVHGMHCTKSRGFHEISRTGLYHREFDLARNAPPPPPRAVLHVRNRVSVLMRVRKPVAAPRGVSEGMGVLFVLAFQECSGPALAVDRQPPGADCQQLPAAKALP